MTERFRDGFHTPERGRVDATAITAGVLVSVLLTAVVLAGPPLALRRVPSSAGAAWVMRWVPALASALVVALVLVAGGPAGRERLRWIASAYALLAMGLTLQVPALAGEGGLTAADWNGAAFLFLTWQAVLPSFALAAVGTSTAPPRVRRVTVTAVVAVLVYAGFGLGPLPLLVAPDGTFSTVFTLTSLALGLYGTLATATWARRVGKRPAWPGAWVTTALACGACSSGLAALAPGPGFRLWHAALVSGLAQLAAPMAGMVARLVALAAADHAGPADESRSRLAAIVDSSDDAITGYSLDGTLTSWNAGAERLYGYTSEEAVGRNVSMLAPDDRLDEVPRNLGRVARGERIEQFDTVRVRKDGATVPVSVTISPVRDAEGTIVGASSITRDMTERTRGDKAKLQAAILESSQDAVVAMNLDGVITAWNPGATALYGFPPEEALGAPADVLLKSEGPAEVPKMLTTLASATGPTALETRHRRRDGSLAEVALTLSAIRDESDRLVGAAIVARDIGEQKRAERVLGTQTRLLQMVAAGAPLQETLDEVVRSVEALSSVETCSVLLVDEGTEEHGVPAAPTLEESDAVAVHPGQPFPSLDRPRPGPVDISDGEVAAEHRHEELDGDGGSRWRFDILSQGDGLSLGSFVLSYPDGNRPDEADVELVERLGQILAVAVDRHRTETKLAYHAIHDPLTGLANRSLLVDRLRQALARRSRQPGSIAVFFLDLDRFKTLNDTRGHEAGDQALVVVAERLREVLRPTDTVARFGGDEFVVLCESLHEDLDAIVIANRISEAVGAPFLLERTEVTLAASIGIALADGDDDSAESLLEQADAAMYQAKEGGRGRFQLFDMKMHAEAMDRLRTEGVLRGALDRGEFQLFYQPQVDLQTNEVIGAEALLRWNHPERGLLAPGAFIDVAEDAKLIVPIGSWVVQEACREAARWRSDRSKSPDVKVSVNLSAHQLARRDLAEIVRAALVESGLDPAALSLEITESVLMEDADAALRTLEGLKSLGVHLSVDDFGTGYSSLAYVNKFPLDELKVDRSFVSGLTRNRDEQTIVSAVIALAHSLGLSAIAEGVETAEQIAELRTLRCESAQGYYWSPPVPPDVLMERLEALRGSGPQAADAEVGALDRLHADRPRR